MATIGQLKKYISDNNLSDDTIIGNSGHFGEYLECIEITTGDVYTSASDNTKIKILVINFESAGEEPC